MTELVALAVLALVFFVATVRSVNMGALALVAAAVVGVTVYGVSVKDVTAGFPSDLFITLVGVTYLFALAKNNGTVDWIVHASVRAVRGRVALVPVVMFVVCALITAIGAVSPAAVAIVAPVAMGFARRYRIHPILMGLSVISGAGAGSFSPIGIFGAITNGVVVKNQLPGNPTFLFLAAFLANLLVVILVFGSYGGRELVARGRETQGLADVERRADASVRAATHSAPPAHTPHSAHEVAEGSAGAAPERGDDAHEAAGRLNVERALSVLGLVVLSVGALAFKLDVGFTALAIAVVLTLGFPAAAKGAVDQISWATILLVGGIVTYVTLLQGQGTVQWLGDEVAQVGAPLLAAFLICLIGAVVSAFASTTGILGALIPLAVPFLLTGQVGAVGLIAALAISSSVVDCSPFSTNGALVVANAEEQDRDLVFRHLMRWGMGLVVAAPVLTWLVLVLPGVL